jgi:hypothetical protein
MSSSSTSTTRREWSRLVNDSLRDAGMWQTLARLLDAQRTYPEDLSLLGYVEIVRNMIVREFVGHAKGLQATPKHSAEFLTDFDRFKLDAQEGYLVSLIDGRLTVQKLIILSPFDPFKTLFILAKLQHERAITVPA